MAELILTEYPSLQEDMSEHIGKPAGLLEQFSSMNLALLDTLAVSILVVLVEVNGLIPVTTVIETLADKKLSWKEVPSRLIEKKTALRHGSRSAERSSAAHGWCGISGKFNYKTDSCYVNPLRAGNRLGLSDGAVNGIDQKSRGSPKKQNHSSATDRKEGGNVDTARFAMACERLRQRMHLAPESLRLHSGTNSNMTPKENRVHSVTECDFQVHLGGDSIVSGKELVTGSVSWLTAQGHMKRSLSKTLVVLLLSTSLLLVPALTQKSIAVLFMPRAAAMFDLKDSYAILGHAGQSKDGVFCTTH